MNMLLSTYCDMILSTKTGNWKGQISVSKFLYLISIIEAIEYHYILDNEISLENVFVRKRFGQLYEQQYDSNKGYEAQFYIRPFYHLGSSEYYHLVWKTNSRPPMNTHTPSEKYLRENLMYAKFDDELWGILQDAESREYIRRNIITRFLTKQ